MRNLSWSTRVIGAQGPSGMLIAAELCSLMLIPVFVITSCRQTTLIHKFMRYKYMLEPYMFVKPSI